MLTPQRVREAESRTGTSTSNGPLRARGKGNEYGATGGHRQGPGVCRHSAEGTGRPVKQGGSAEVISSLTSNCQGFFHFCHVCAASVGNAVPGVPSGAMPQGSCPQSVKCTEPPPYGGRNAGDGVPYRFFPSFPGNFEKTIDNYPGAGACPMSKS